MDESKEYIDDLGAQDSHDVSFSIRRAKPRRVKLAKKVSQRKFIACTCRLKYYNPASVSTASIEEGFIPQIPWHAIFVFLDPILLDVMRVEYQNQKKSPFDTHPLQKNIFLITICIYGALIGIKVHTKTRRTSFGEDSQLWSSPFWSVFFTVPSLHLDAATTPVDCAHHMGLHTTNTVSSNAQKCSMLDTKILGEVDMGFFSETFFSMWERYLSKS